MYNKPHLNWQNQLQKLQTKNLTINDKTKALKELENLNYYRLSVYFIPFYNQNSNCFKSGVSFEDIIDLYNFDMELRAIVFKALQTIELYFRTQIAYHHTKDYNPLGYLDSANFIPKYKMITSQDLINKIKQLIDNSKEVFIKHHRKKYGQYDIPLWASVELMSFGELSNFYALMHTKQQQDIAKKLNVNQKVIINWLHSLTYLRNICAHHSRLWNKSLAIKIDIPKNISTLTTLKLNTQKPFSYFTIMVYMLEQIGDYTFKKDFIDLISKYKNINLAHMGVCKNFTNTTHWII